MNSVTENTERKELVDISKEMEELRDRFHAVTEKFRTVRVAPIIRESHVQPENRPLSMGLHVYRFIS